MQNEKRENLIIIGLVTIIAILSVTLVVLLTSSSDVEKDSIGGNNNIENNELNTNQDSNVNNISYKIVEETSNEGVVFKKLYVNGKEVSFENKATNIEVIQMNDILIVETALSSKTLYAVSNDAEVIGVFTTSNNNFYKNTNIIPTKYTYRDTYRIEGNSIYIQTDKLSQDSKYALCNLLASKDDEVVLYEEKFEYLGNDKFSTPIVTKKVTRREYMQEHNIKCNDTSSNENIKEENNKDISWQEYLLNSDIVYRRYISKFNKTENREVSFSLSMYDLKELLNELKDYKIKKTYIQDVVTKYRTVFDIIYEKNEQYYEFDLGEDSIISTTDEELLKILDDSVSVVENSKYKNNSKYKAVFYLEPSVDYILDKYYERAEAVDKTKGILKSVLLYYTSQLLEPTGMTETRIFTFKGTKYPTELSLTGKIDITGKITLTKDGDVRIGTYNENTKQYEGNLIVDGYTCKQINYESSLKYDVICKK